MHSKKNNKLIADVMQTATTRPAQATHMWRALSSMRLGWTGLAELTASGLGALHANELIASLPHS